MVRWCNKDEFSRKLKAKVKISEWLQNVYVFCFISQPTSQIIHFLPLFLSFFLFLKPKCSWMKWVFWTQQLMKMSLEEMAWSATAHVGKAGFGTLKRTSSLPIPAPTRPPLQSCIFLSSCVQDRKWREFFLRKKSTLKSTLKFSYNHVTGLKLRWLPRWLENC